MSYRGTPYYSMARDAGCRHGAEAEQMAAAIEADQRRQAEQQWQREADERAAHERVSEGLMGNEEWRKFAIIMPTDDRVGWGPFDTREEAVTWAEDKLRGSNYSVLQLTRLPSMALSRESTAARGTE